MLVRFTCSALLMLATAICSSPIDSDQMIAAMDYDDMVVGAVQPIIARWVVESNSLGKISALKGISSSIRLYCYLRCTAY